MIQLQHLIYPELSASMPDTQMYFRGSDKLRLVNNGLLIPKYEKVDFNTYLNFFSTKKWRNLTHLPNLVVNIHGRGSMVVDVVGIKELANETFEEVIASQAIFEDNMVTIEVSNFESVDALYLRVQTLDQEVMLFSANFATKEPIRGSVSLGICVPVYKHPYILAANLRKLDKALNHMDIDVKFVIINQGEFYDFNTINPERIHTNQQRNLGQTGAVVQTTNIATSLGCTHIALVHDDLEILPEAIFRIVRFYQFVIPIRRDVCIAGAILSQSPRWEVLEINTLIKVDNYIRPEAGLDVREPRIAFDLATCDSQRASSRWGFTVFTTKIFQAYDYPMPLFVQGSDIEFMSRINKETISLNGICGWHTPKNYSYSAVNEDYYFVRNAMINALLAPKPQFAMIDKLVWQRFWHNIKTYNYIGARLNLYAVNHILRKKYEADSEDINQWVNKLYQLEESRIRYTYIGKQSNVAVNDTKTRITQVTAYLNPLKKMKGVSKIGENRDEQDFMGKNEVYVLDPLTGTAEIALLKRKKIAQLTSQMIKAYALFRKDHQKIKKELLFFKNASTTSEYWQEVLNKK